MASDKSRIKKSKKTAELAKQTISVPKHGQRFFNVFEWGEEIADILLCIDERLRNIENSLANAVITKVQSIQSNATVYITTTKTAASDATILKEETKILTSDAEVS